MIQQILAIWSLVPLPFLNPAWTSGSSQFMYCWSLAWRILSITLYFHYLGNSKSFRSSVPGIWDKGQTCSLLFNKNKLWKLPSQLTEIKQAWKKPYKTTHFRVLNPSLTWHFRYQSSPRPAQHLKIWYALNWTILWELSMDHYQQEKNQKPGASPIRHGFSVSWETDSLVEHWTLGLVTVRQSSCPVNDHRVTKQKALIIFLKRIIKHSQHEANSPVIIILLLFKNNGCKKKHRGLIITLQKKK